MTSPSLSEKEIFETAVHTIQEKAPGFSADIGIVLGSGSSDLALRIENKIVIPYDNIPGLHKGSVKGHPGEFVLGTLNGVSVFCLRGRIHYYENPTHAQVRTLIRLMKAFSCKMMLATNASGSIRSSFLPGELVLVSDHINFQGQNPLVGRNDEDFGPRFYPMHDAYDLNLRKIFHHTAKTLSQRLHEGVYIGVLGPNFETPAEIRAFRTLGADIVGMSTVPDVLVARHAGLRVAVIAIVTNLAADISTEALSHESTLFEAEKAQAKVANLIFNAMPALVAELNK